MFVKNTSARLITINVKGEKPVRVLPGNNPAVEISKAAEKLTFTQLLLKKGALREASQVETVVENDDEKDQLVADLKELGVEVDSRWGVKRLKAELEKAVEDNG